MKPLLISACLLGVPCRYDGKSKGVERVRELEKRFQLIPVCPETAGGLETPRLPCERSGDRILRSDGADLTVSYGKGAEAALALAKEHGCRLALLKEKSPSCGSRFRYDGTFSGKLVPGRGVTAELLSQNGIRVFSEEQVELLLTDAKKRSPDG